MYFIINKMSRYLNQRANPFGPQIRCTKNTFANLIFVSGMERSGFPETPILLGFGKSYLIPETTNFDIGEGID